MRAITGCLGLAIMGVFVGGCSVDLRTDFVSGSGGDATPGGADKVLVRFVNEALDVGVDVEFYATNDPVEAVPDDLFADAFRVTEGIGFLGSGELGPGAQDAVEFDCTADLTIGTRGGTFLDPETHEAVGEGTARWTQEAQLGLCGQVITFTYSPDGEGFDTTMSVGD